MKLEISPLLSLFYISGADPKEYNAYTKTTQPPLATSVLHNIYSWL